MRSFCAISVVGLTLLSSTARAEPVTFAFDIQIQQRCTALGCAVFSDAFPLYLTIDQVGSGGKFERSYGEPVFSAVPLERRPLQPGGSITTTAIDLLFYGEPFKWRRVAHVFSGVDVQTGDVSYRWSTSLYRAEDYVWPLPDLTAASLVEFLGSARGAGFFGYSYAGVLPGGGVTPDSIAYLGTARLAAPAPVPEPGSVLLVGCGVLGLLRRRRGDRVASCRLIQLNR
jgi:hypothetical protein